VQISKLQLCQATHCVHDSACKRAGRVRERLLVTSRAEGKAVTRLLRRCPARPGGEVGPEPVHESASEQACVRRPASQTAILCYGSFPDSDSVVRELPRQGFPGSDDKVLQIERFHMKNRLFFQGSRKYRKRDEYSSKQGSKQKQADASKSQQTQARSDISGSCQLNNS
jgi:hypothetical protein